MIGSRVKGMIPKSKCIFLCSTASILTIFKRCSPTALSRGWKRMERSSGGNREASSFGEVQPVMSLCYNIFSDPGFSASESESGTD